MKPKKELIDGVNFLTERNDSFSSSYILVREIEGRVLSDAEVAILPMTDSKNPYSKEWQLRAKSTQRILTYLKKKNKQLKILDIGCGNGWFTNHLASIENVEVHGLDINSAELEQAARIFKKANLRFIYANFFEIPSFFENDYDIITLNASIQYFENVKELLTVLRSFLKPNGEIHIIDSPFYDESQVEAAMTRTQNYYEDHGVPQMSEYYFHHSKEILAAATILYSPKRGIFEKLSFSKDIPFYWVKFG